jgi:hypothetical protein
VAIETTGRPRRSLVSLIAVTTVAAVFVTELRHGSACSSESGT